MEDNKKIEEAKQNLLKDLGLDIVEDMLQRNTIEFEIDKQEYRVRKATFKEKKEAYDLKVRKFGELIQDEQYSLEQTLKDNYKKRGISVDGMIAQINTMETTKNNLQMKLGKLLEDKGPEQELEILRKEIEDIKQEQYLVSLKRTNLMQFCIESQVLIHAYQFLTSKVTEKLVDGAEGEDKKWVTLWKSYDDFTESDEKLVNTASFNASLLIGQI